MAVIARLGTLLLGLSLLFGAAAVAQEKQDEVRLRDGRVIRGKVVELAGSTVVFRTAAGLQELKRADVDAIFLDRDAAAGGEGGPADGQSLAGAWLVTLTDPYATYKYRWELRPDGRGRYRVKHTLVETTHGFHKQDVGKSWDDMTLVATGAGRFRTERVGNDGNPGNPGSFRQEASGTVDGARISGEGTHKGTAITHPFKIEGRRDTDPLAGTWQSTWTDPYATYKYRWEVRPDGPGRWRVRHTLVDTTHGFHKQSIGKSWDDITLLETAPGKVRMVRDGKDDNPGNAGTFKQEAELKLEGVRLSGEGTHKGQAITHPFKVEATREVVGSR